jgi:hypothetical protein
MGRDAVPQRFALRGGQLSLASAFDFSQAAAVGMLSLLRFLRSSFGMNSVTPNCCARINQEGASYQP